MAVVRSQIGDYMLGDESDGNFVNILNKLSNGELALNAFKPLIDIHKHGLKKHNFSFLDLVNAGKVSLSYIDTLIDLICPFSINSPQEKLLIEK